MTLFDRADLQRLAYLKERYRRAGPGFRMAAARALRREATKQLEQAIAQKEQEREGQTVDVH